MIRTTGTTIRSIPLITTIIIIITITIVLATAHIPITATTTLVTLATLLIVMIVVVRVLVAARRSRKHDVIRNITLAAAVEVAVEATEVTAIITIKRRRRIDKRASVIAM